MPSLSSLANIPGYGAYITKREMNERAGIKDLQEQGVLLGLQQKMQEIQRQNQLNKALEESGGDLEAAMQGAIKAKNLDAAAKIASIIDARRKAKEGKIVAPGSQLLGPNNEVLHTTPFKPETPPAEPPDVRLVEFYSKLPETDPRKAILKQVIDAKTRAPEKTYPVITAEQGIFERRPGGLVRLTAPSSGTPLTPQPRTPQVPKIPGEIQRMNIAMNSLEKGLDAYEDLLKKFNPRNPRDMLDPAKRAEAESLVADLRMQAKEANALGALTGPDMEILDALLKNPVTWAAAYYGRGGLTNQLSQARDALKRRREGIARQYPQAEQTPASPKVVDFGDLK